MKQLILFGMFILMRKEDKCLLLHLKDLNNEMDEKSLQADKLVSKHSFVKIDNLSRSAITKDCLRY